MDGNEQIFVTGGTGFLGARLIRELLLCNPDVGLALLIRDSGSRAFPHSAKPAAAQSPQQRADTIVPDHERARVRVVEGDISRDNLGIEVSAWNRLVAETTRVVHCAATVRFDHTLDEARRINVDGTRRVLDFAAKARKLRSIAYVGTAYAAGERSGLILESELAVGQKYRNTYEQTKAEAEALVQSKLRDIPGMVLRPSIIVGDSLTGATSSFKMMYWPLKIYARSLWRTIPGYPDAVLDIVPVDYVAKAVAHLMFNPDALGSTVHLCAGPGGSATVQQIAQRAAECFGVRKPRYVDPRIFFAAVRPLLYASLWGRRRKVLRSGRAYRDYFTMRMQFDTTNAERLLKPAGLQPPQVMDYLDRLFHYCVASDWGKKPVVAQDAI